MSEQGGLVVNLSNTFKWAKANQKNTHTHTKQGGLDDDHEIAEMLVVVGKSNKEYPKIKQNDINDWIPRDVNKKRIIDNDVPDFLTDSDFDDDNGML